VRVSVVWGMYSEVMVMLFLLSMHLWTGVRARISHGDQPLYEHQEKQTCIIIITVIYRSNVL
jgi:hypothetical protein